VAPNKTDVLQGTLDLMVLKTLDSVGTQHGYGIAQRLQQVSDDLQHLNQGTLYPALLRLEQLVVPQLPASSWIRAAEAGRARTSRTCSSRGRWRGSVS
jgi:hypothetical protein